MPQKDEDENLEFLNNSEAYIDDDFEVLDEIDRQRFGMGPIKPVVRQQYETDRDNTLLNAQNFNFINSAIQTLEKE